MRNLVKACISSRITTVIRLERCYQMNYNWYNELSAVSQLELLILRLAWLNLWDEHMTTGRINQVIIKFGLRYQVQTWWLRDRNVKHMVVGISTCIVRRELLPSFTQHHKQICQPRIHDLYNVIHAMTRRDSESSTCRAVPFFCSCHLEADSGYEPCTGRLHW